MKTPQLLDRRGESQEAMEGVLLMRLSSWIYVLKIKLWKSSRVSRHVRDLSAQGSFLVVQKEIRRLTAVGSCRERGKRK